MNATTLMVITVALVSAVSWVVRYRILNMYSRLPPEPQRKEPEIDLFPDTHDEGVKSGLSSYLDEFLSAIKIFGYLERPVFHELTRSMQTRKLIAGETFNLEEEKGFCIVVDGMVEIFVKSGRSFGSPEASANSEGDPLDGEDDALPHGEQYQLLTEVKNGAPMSSLFSIMSLFTEDIKLTSTEAETPVRSTASSANYRFSGVARTSVSRHVSQDAAASMPGTPRFVDVAENNNDRVHEDLSRPSYAIPSSNQAAIPPISLDGSEPKRIAVRPTLPGRAASTSAHPDIIARATVDTTIAIIPASAFRRLTKVYPKATSHIVHVILSRFQRVTLATAYRYLGLTSEVLLTEKSMNRYTTWQLPNMLRGDALLRLKEKFGRERQRAGEDSETKGIALHNANAHRRRKSSVMLRKDAVLHSMSKQTSYVATTIAPPGERLATQTPSPGDLLATTNMSREVPGHNFTDSPVEHVAEAMRLDQTSPLAQRTFNPFASVNTSRVPLDPRDVADEDNLFRTSILECMFRAIGLGVGGTVSREPESMEGSPRLFSYDQRRQKAMFGNHNAFGIMDPFDGSVDGDTESLTSGGLALNTPPSAQSLANDLRDDAEIVFFPQGSVLVEQGERNPGLYYVIDGFLDICTTSEESSASILQPGVRASTAGLTSGATPAPDHNIHGRDNAQDKRKKSVRRSVSLIKPGGLAGYIGALSSYRSFIDVVAKTDVYVGFLPRASLERIVDRYPIILLTMAKRLTSLLPRLLLHIDFALDWDQVSAGQVIFHNGDESEAIYIVLNGRLRLVEDREGGGMTARAEFGQGDSVVGPVNGAISLNQSAILNHLGKHAFNKMGKLKLSQYLADLEEKYGLVVYVADTNVNSPWTQTCIAQADSILLVGLGEGSPEIGEYERFMLGMKSTARKILVLLHAERYSSPGLTRSWLRNRMWINGGHYHLQMAFRTNMMPSHPPSKRSNTTLKERVQILQAEIQKYTSRKVRHTPYYSPDAPFKGDFHRLARRLCGKSVGLVLGGGGARGITQIGIIQAMEEAGIPIDVVGGTSMGSFVGALYARHADIVPIFGLAKKFSGRMASMWRFALDLTYPTSSYTTGHEFNRGIFKTFGKAQIEDFWLEFYCNTTNISKSRAEYHTSGYAWRYIRASMSLAGLLPPLSDEGSMLLDGGYIDNLTVSHMKRLGVDTIFAVDVGSLDDDTPQSYGDSLSGVWAFFNRWNPFSTTPNPPTLAEIQARLAYVSSVDALERAKAMPGCLYMRPPIDDYGTLDFGKFDEIYQVGYKYGQEFLQKMKDDGVLPLVEETEAKKALRRTMAPRRASI
ncbi:hypothetical protein VD0004_g4483 [Verticillium dahliae]|nr:hypothetical protein VD0004_g4483 [Verticillium dahliae]